MVIGYTGEWFTFTTLTGVIMTSMKFTERPGLAVRVPGLFVIYARNLDGDPWTPVHTQSIMAAAGAVIPVNLGGVCYLQYGMVVNELLGPYETDMKVGVNDAVLNFVKWKIMGKYHYQYVSPYVNSVNEVMTQKGTYSQRYGNSLFMRGMNPVTSMYRGFDTIWSWPTLPSVTFTRCWVVQTNTTFNWIVACYKNYPPTYIIDQTTQPIPTTEPVMINAVTYTHMTLPTNHS